MAFSSAVHGAGRGSSSPLLNWPCALAALTLFAASTVVAWLQAPPPVPLARDHAPWTFLDVMETNPHRRLLSVLDDLNGVYFAEGGRQGWAVGDHGRILATDDGGNNWREQESTTQEKLTSVIFQPDALHGWAGTDDRALVATVDGGKRWRLSEATWDDLKKNTKLDTSFGVLVGAQTTPKSGAANQTPLSVWPIGTDGTVPGRVTNETGASAQGSYGHGRLIAGHIDRGNLLAWAVGRAGTIIATDDGGQTWHPQTSTAQPRLAGLWIAPDGTRAWAVGSLGTILASTDGGRSWKPQRSGVRDDLNAVTFMDDGLRGWVGGENGSIVATRDGGTTWKEQYGGNDGLSITGFYYSPADEALMVFADDLDDIEEVSRDGGSTWALGNDKEPGMSGLSSVGFSPNGKGWALQRAHNPLVEGGTLVRSKDNGKTWSAAAKQDFLLSASFTDDGAHGVAIAGVSFDKGPGPKWSMMTTNDGGDTWHVQPDIRHLQPSAVKLANDGLHGLALAAGSQILVTDDGGQHWAQAESYRRSPPPWYWLAGALSVGLAWMSWRLRPSGAARSSVADVAASDAEIRLPADDRLQFGGLARGISRFLRNTETQPPLTLAITGDWGSGKSSLMQLVCADLRRYGHRPIWFNAWHHQKEEHLFAALLGAIHAQAVPPLFSMNGLSFRLRLLWLRSWRHFGVMMIVVAAVTALVLFSVRALEHGGIGNVVASIDALSKIGSRPPGQIVSDPIGGALSALFAALTALFAVLKGTKPFGVNPALLLGAAREQMSLKSAAAQNDFRTRFAQQFEELTHALPYRMVIIVDDLDRCRASSVIDVMEAVNYLTSSGKCFVIFGMATERVTAALGLAFKDIAAELVRLEDGADGDAEPAPPNPAHEQARRHAYAADYLQKLVNIEIKVPVAEEQAQHRLLLTAEPDERRRAARFFSEVKRLWPLIPACLAIAAGMWLADQAGQSLGQSPGAQPPASITPAPAGKAALAAAAISSPVAPARPPVRAPAPVKQDDSPAYQVGAGEVTSVRTMLAWSALACLPLLATAALIALQLLRRTVFQIRDSIQFQQALEIWTPVVAGKRNTPRSIKRFGNRLRYLAMLQQGEAQDKTILDQLLEQLRQLHARGESVGGASAGEQPAVSEYQLIAMGALYEIFGPDWKDYLTKISRPGVYLADTSANRELTRRLKQAVQAHQARFNTVWPPSAAEIQVFERLVAGVRLAGDPRMITPSSAPPASAENYKSARSKGAEIPSAAE